MITTNAELIQKSNKLVKEVSENMQMLSDVVHRLEERIIKLEMKDDSTAP